MDQFVLICPEKHFYELSTLIREFFPLCEVLPRRAEGRGGLVLTEDETAGELYDETGKVLYSRRVDETFDNYQGEASKNRAKLVIYRLMADSSQKYAHIYRASIFGYIWLAPVGCHMNVGLMNYAYKRLLLLDAAVASEAANVLIWAFCVPLWVLLIAFWLPGMITQFKAFARGYTPYPARAKWFSVLVGMWPALIIAAIVGSGSALGGGIGTMFLSFGNLFMFGGLLATLPDQKRFEQFEASLPTSSGNEVRR